MLKSLIDKITLKTKIELRHLQKQLSGEIIKNENISKSYIKRFLPDNPVIIEAGAHVGGDSVEMSRLFKNARIHAFEPVPNIYRSLIHNVRKYKSIYTYQLALSDRNGEQEINISSGASDASSSLLKPSSHLTDHPDVLFNDAVMVKAITLDEWARENQINKIDFMWLDLQGYELPVLRRSEIIFPTVKVVHMEVSTRPTYENASQYSEVRDWMEGKGFRVDKEAIPEGWDMGNVLFVRDC